MTTPWPIEDPGDQSQAEAALDVRRAQAGYVVGEGIGGLNAAGSPGLPDDLLVSAATGLDFTVAKGLAFIQGDVGDMEGIYAFTLDADATVTASAGDATNPRIDLVVLQIANQFYGDLTTGATLAIVEGTPAASPTAPAVPDSALLLAQYTMPAGATTSAAATLTDMRIPASYGSPDAPRVRYHKGNGDQSLASGVAEYIGFSSADYGSRFGLQTANDTYTIVEDGIYAVHASLVYEASAAGGRRRCYIHINGSKVGGVQTPPCTGGTTDLDAYTEIDLIAGDVVQIQGLHDAGANLHVLDAASTHLTIRKAGPLPE